MTFPAGDTEGLIKVEEKRCDEEASYRIASRSFLQHNKTNKVMHNKFTKKKPIHNLSALTN